MNANRLTQTAVPKAADKAAALRMTCLFREMPQDLLTEAADLASPRVLTAGEVLFFEQEKASSLYVVIRGQLRAVRLNHGREQVLSIDPPGSVIAAAPALNGATFYCTEIADTDAQVLCLPSSHFVELCRRHPALLWSTAELLARIVRNQADLIEMLALQSVAQRVARYLLGLPQTSSPQIGIDRVLKVNSTQAEMASRLGKIGRAHV